MQLLFLLRVHFNESTIVPLLEPCSRDFIYLMVEIRYLVQIFRAAVAIPRTDRHRTVQRFTMNSDSLVRNYMTASVDDVEDATDIIKELASSKFYTSTHSTTLISLF